VIRSLNLKIKKSKKYKKRTTHRQKSGCAREVPDHKRDGYFIRFREQRKILFGMNNSFPCYDTGRKNRRELRAVCNILLPKLFSLLTHKEDRRIILQLKRDYIGALNIVHFCTQRQPYNNYKIWAVQTRSKGDNFVTTSQDNPGQAKLY